MLYTSIALPAQVWSREGYGHNAQEQVQLHLLLRPYYNTEDGKSRHPTFSQRYTGRGGCVGQYYLFCVAGGYRLDMHLPAILIPNLYRNHFSWPELTGLD